MESPRTLVAQWIKAIALGEGELQEDLRQQLDATGWIDAPVVMETAFMVAIRHRFMGGRDMEHVRQFVQSMRTRFGEKAVPQKQTELLVRRELGEDIKIGKIDTKTLFSLKVMVFGVAAMDLGLDELRMDLWLAEAEKIAFNWGYKPTLESEYPSNT